MARAIILCASVVALTSSASTGYAAEEAPPPDADASASGSLSLSTSDGAQAEGSSEATPPASSGGGADSYLQRYKPEPGLFELGLFGGLLFPSDDHNLQNEQYPHRPYGPIALVGGGRVGYYPLCFLGIEGEAAMMPTAVDNGPSAMFATTRFHLVGQLPIMSIVPFVTLGGGALHTYGRTMGHDGDPVIYFGAGAKVPFNQLLSARLDLRDNMTQAESGGSGAQAHHPEVLFGITVTLERERPAETSYEPPPDRDGDRLPDEEDKCPDQSGPIPDGCPVDTDGDGVLDEADECPREAGEAPAGCPNRDADADGVPLPCDQCPEEKGVAPDGCPVRDADGDGILDDQDKCAQEPETKNGYQDDDGCADEVPAAAEETGE